MKRFLCIALALIAAQAVAGHRLVRVHSITTASLYQLMEEGYDVASIGPRQSYVDLLLPEDEVPDIQLRFTDVELLPREWGELLPENSRNAGYYYSHAENWEFWCSLAAEYGDLVDTPVSIGQSYQSRDIYMIRMTSPVGEQDYKPPIYFSSLIHAREPGSNSVLIDFAMWLTENYDGGDTRAAWILDNTTVYFVPVGNPDGYIYNLPGGGYHRKNMNFTLGNGIDLNRNWGHQWGYDNSGSSPNPNDETYRGTGPFSEPETQVQRDFIASIDPIAAMNYHTYGGYLLYPWGYNNTPTPDQSTFESWSAAMTSYNGYEYGRAGEVLYDVNGDQNDWMYCGDSGPAVLSFTPEVDDNGFWGGQNDSTLIADFCEECRYMNIWLCMTAPGQVGVGESHGEGIGPALALSAVTPNPVLGAASMTVEAPAGSQVEVSVYDLRGRLVETVASGSVGGGTTTFTWQVPGDLPAGVYSAIARSASGSSATRRFTVLR